VVDLDVMKFFVPFTSGPSERDNVYQGIRRSVGLYTGAALTVARIFRLEYMEEGAGVLVEVGQPHPINGEVVMAIFYDEGQDLFFVCTPHRGAMRHRPFVVRGATVKIMREFTA
jgi:hypothetical protein